MADSTIASSISLNKDLLDRLRELALELAPGTCALRLGNFDLHVARRSDRGTSSHCFERPLISLTVQGSKLIQACGREFALTPGTLLVTCVDMPSVSSLLDASPQKPYLGFFVELNRNILADLFLKNAASFSGASPEQSAWVMDADDDFMDAFLRLARLAKRPERAKILAPLILRELHCMLLLAPQGGVLSRLYKKGGRDARITDVIAWLRSNLAVSASMNELAKMANMSVSSFHRHFKEITGLSPLQYHKKLRLHEAQRLMLGENQRAAEAALAVGYESITQFNREYRRMFGEPPGRDIASRRRKFAG